MKKSNVLAVALATSMALGMSGCNAQAAEFYAPAEEQYEDINTEGRNAAFVNEDFYNNMLAAKENFDKLFDSGIVSNQMINNGNNLSDEECEYIDSNLYSIYGIIEQYIDCYQKNNVDGCVAMGEALYDKYDNGLNKEFLYNVMIRRQLPLDYQANIYYDIYGNCYDASDSIMLDNGASIRIVGEEDKIVTNDYASDFYTDVYERSQWFVDLPEVLRGHYSVIDDEYNRDVCYLWNDYLVNKTVNREWIDIKNNVANMYWFDPSNARIIEEDGMYYCVSNDGEYYGEVGYDDSVKIGNIFYVEDALATNSGDALALDAFIDSMNNYTVTYTK